MDFYTFEPTASAQGDKLSASDAVDKPLIAHVVERRDGIKTKFSPDGAPGLILDVADILADQVYVGILWMNSTLVDQLGQFIGKNLPIKLVYAPPKNGGHPYITVEALKGQELTAAQQWGQANPNRFDQRRTQLAVEAQTQAAQTGATGNMAQVAAQTAAPATDGQTDVQSLLAQLAAAQAK